MTAETQPPRLTPVPGTPALAGGSERSSRTRMVPALPISRIRPNPNQPRQAIDPDALDELAQSLAETDGPITPVVVRVLRSPWGVTDTGEPWYELIAGERRVRAAISAGMTTIPAVVRDTSDADLLRESLIENLHRADLNPVDLARAYRQLLDTDPAMRTAADVARAIGRTEEHVQLHLKLLKLPTSALAKVSRGDLTFGHVRPMFRLLHGDPTVIDLLAQRAVDEKLSVRAIEDLVGRGNLPGHRDRDVHRRKPHRPKPRPGSFTDIEVSLAAKLDTPVRAALYRGRARIIIEFDPSDTGRLMGILNTLPDPQ